jgi:inhibitor of KinA
LLLKLGIIYPLQYSISPLNETALLVSFENIIDKNINEKVIALAQALQENRFKGFIETVPAYNSLAIFYDTAAIKKYHVPLNTAYEFVKDFTEEKIKAIKILAQNHKQLIRIPVYYNGEDLAAVANEKHLTAEEVIHIHTSITYRVFMIGFLPGFAYMGKVDERIAVPRLSSPRTNVKAGAVGIAGFQTGIYPLRSPGGWKLIGQTPLKIFDVQKENPCLLKAGDNVQFIAITKEVFEKLNEY